MRAVPLAAVLFFASSAVAADCVVPMSDANRPGAPALSLDEGSPDCRAAAGLVDDFAKLRAAAGFTAEQLAFSIDPNQKSVNAYYAPGGVWVTRAYLASAHGPEAFLASLSHEIGHGVQDRQGLLAWKREPHLAFVKRTAGHRSPPPFGPSREGVEYLERSRRIESHADAIGQELLQRAGYSIDLFARGRADRFGCDGVEGLDDPAGTHPADARRYLNAAMTNGALAQERALAAARGGFGGAASAEADAPVVRPFVPAARIADYEGDGSVKPGRRAAANLRVPPPPPDAGPLEVGANRAAAAAMRIFIAPPFAAAVNHLTDEEGIASRVLAACGTPGAAQFDEDFSIRGWTRRIAADAAEGLVAVHRAWTERDRPPRL